MRNILKRITTGRFTEVYSFCTTYKIWQIQKVFGLFSDMKKFIFGLTHIFAFKDCYYSFIVRFFPPILRFCDDRVAKLKAQERKTIKNRQIAKSATK